MPLAASASKGPPRALRRNAPQARAAGRLAPAYPQQQLSGLPRARSQVVQREPAGREVRRSLVLRSGSKVDPPLRSRGLCPSYVDGEGGVLRLPVEAKRGPAAVRLRGVARGGRPLTPLTRRPLLRLVTRWPESVD